MKFKYSRIIFFLSMSLIFLSISNISSIETEGTSATSESKQKLISLNTGYLEIGGVAGHYSFNYDRILLQTNLVNISVGVGFSHGVIESDIKFTPRFPLRLNFFRSIVGVHHAELGLAYNPYLTPRNDLYHSVFANLGYRYQKTVGGLFIKAAFSPMIFNNAVKFIPWAAVSVGYSF